MIRFDLRVMFVSMHFAHRHIIVRSFALMISPIFRCSVHSIALCFICIDEGDQIATISTHREDPGHQREFCV